ncbi:MAG: hypothetical protein ACLSB9_37835 [Hydrogeniiclostridium mannosilyticum]
MESGSVLRGNSLRADLLRFLLYSGRTGAAYSFTDWNGISAEKTFVGVQNYVDAFNSDYLRMTLRFTVIFAVMVLVLTNILGLFLAVLLDKRSAA